jgi:hypothetical protein
MPVLDKHSLYTTNLRNRKDPKRFADQRLAIGEPPALSLALPGSHPALSRREVEQSTPSRWSWMYFRHFLLCMATSMMRRSAEEGVSCTPLCRIMMH